MTGPIELPDPVFYRDRACRTAGLAVFYPRDGRGAGPAKKICGQCPRLSACARWAYPMVESGALSECVIAGVYIPRRRTRTRETVAAVLTDLAHAARGARKEGGAAWTAA